MKTCVMIFLCLSLLGCHSKDTAMSAPESTIREASLENSPVSQAASPPDISKSYVPGNTKLIRKAEYEFEVKNVKNTTAGIETIVLKHPAYIAGSNLSTRGNIVENKIIIRVQADSFDSFLKDLDVLAEKVERREISTTDVGKEYVDLESRLKTKREVEARYMNILRKNTGTIEEILSAERQIGEIHEEIEATISRLNYLKEQVAYSTITATFYETAPVLIAENDPVYHKLSEAFLSGLHGSIETIILLVNIWPMLIVGSLVYYFFRVKRKNANA